MTKEEFYEIMLQIDVDAYEFAKDKGEFKNICMRAYAIGANAMLRKIFEKE